MVLRLAEHQPPAWTPATLGELAPVAQGIERCPAEAEVARSNRAGRVLDALTADRLFRADRLTILDCRMLRIS